MRASVAESQLTSSVTPVQNGMTGDADLLKNSQMNESFNMMVAWDRFIKHCRVGLNGALFAMSKKRKESHTLFFVHNLVDFFQLAAIALPTVEVIDFEFPEPVQKLADVFAISHFDKQLADWLGVFPLFITCLVVAALEIANFLYVGYAWASNEFNHLWAIMLLRQCMSVLAGVLYIPIVSILSNIFTCNGIDNETMCAALLPVTIVLLAGFITISLIVSVSLFDPSPTSPNPSAMAHSRITTFKLFVRTVYAILFSILSKSTDNLEQRRLAWSGVNVSASLILAYLFTWYQPFNQQLVTYTRAMLSNLLLWFATSAFIHILSDGSRITVDLAIGLVVVPVMTTLLIELRKLSVLLKPVSKCNNPFEVELKARIFLQKIDMVFPSDSNSNEGDRLLQNGEQSLARTRVARVADRANIASGWYLEAAKKFTDSSILAIFHAHMLLDLMPERVPLIRRAILLAEQRGIPADFSFIVFRSKRLLNEGGKEDALSYVRQEKYMKEALSFDRRCLVQLLDFWQELSVKRPNFRKVRDMAQSIAFTSAEAHKRYVNLLEVAPKSVRAHELFGGFMQDVMNDSSAANAFNLKAKRLESQRLNSRKNNRDDSKLLDSDSEGVGMIVFKVGLGTSQAEFGEITAINVTSSMLLLESSQNMVGADVSKYLLPTTRKYLMESVYSFYDAGKDKWCNETLHTFLRTCIGTLVPATVQFRPQFVEADLNVHMIFASPQTSDGYQNSSFVVVDAHQAVIGFSQEAAILFPDQFDISQTKKAFQDMGDDPSAQNAAAGLMLSDVVLNGEKTLLRHPQQFSDKKKKASASLVPVEYDGRNLHCLNIDLPPPTRLERRGSHASIASAEDGKYMSKISPASLALLATQTAQVDEENKVEVWMRHWKCGATGDSYFQIFCLSNDNDDDDSMHDSDQFGVDEAMSIGSAGAVSAADKEEYGPTGKTASPRSPAGLGLRNTLVNENFKSRRSVASSGAASATSTEFRKSKAKMVRSLLSQSWKSGMDPTLRRLRSSYIRVSILVLGVAFFEFWKASSFIETFHEDVTALNGAGLRRFCVVAIAYAVRSLMLINEGILSSDLEAGFRNDLVIWATKLKDLDRVIFEKRAALGQELQTLYEQPVIDFVYMGNDEIHVDQLSCYDANLRISSEALQASHRNLSEFVSTDPTMFPLVANLGAFSNSSVRHGLEWTTTAYVEFAQLEIAQVADEFFQASAITFVVVILLVLQTLYPLIGNGGKIETVKSEVLEVFAKIPKKVARDVLERYEVRLRNVHGEELHNTTRRARSNHPAGAPESSGADAGGQATGAENGKSKPEIQVPEALAPKKDQDGGRRTTRGGRKVAPLDGGKGNNEKGGSRMSLLRNPASLFNLRKVLIVLRMSAILILCFAYFFAMLYTIGQFERSYSGKPYEVNLAGFRRMKSRFTRHRLQEWLSGAYVTEPALFHPLQNTPDQVREILQELGSVHRQLLYGNASQNLEGTFREAEPNQDIMVMYTQNGCFKWPNADTMDDCLAFRDGILSTGLQSAFQQFYTAIEQVTYDTDVINEVASGELSRITALLADPELNLSFELEQKYLQVQFTTVIKAVGAELEQVVEQEKRLFLTFFVAFSVSTVLTYLLVIRQSLASLDVEVKRTRSLLLVIPEDVVDGLKHIQEFLLNQFGNLIK
ncbi:Tiny macrocysts protein B (Gamete enriched gene 04 protein) (cAMP pathway regulator tmcB) [Durusdinium trenchii]|uniref:Tiny macrocysts protein B (Gamete enriched gene 04 protein) (cAMP pathway regulator tmcB) n=1 Tax=Durusdinium trenchii TaxID=1381693 RepID=A0ABP0HIN0_9DINO